MQSDAATVVQYLAELPSDRRDAIDAVRRLVLKNLDNGFEEGMQYGMIGYFVPHSRFPQGYHCDPKQPLPFAGLASQKNHMSLYLMPLYGESDLLRRFEQLWSKSGKKLDMGKCCIRFKKVEDLDFSAIQDLLRSVSAEKYITHYLKNLGNQASKKTAAQKSAPKSGPQKSVSRKASTKPVATTAAKKKVAGSKKKAESAKKLPPNPRKLSTETQSKQRRSRDT